MLQYIIKENGHHSVAELAQKAIDGGCTWLQLHVPGMDDAEVRRIADELIPVCKDAGVILTIEDRPELAKELSIHGVHLTGAYHGTARKVREDLGPGAIVGTQVGDAQSILSLRGADIDYVTLDPALSIEKDAEIIRAARLAGSDMPVVIAGNVTPDTLPAMLAAGANGVAASDFITNADDPVQAVKELLAIKP